MPPHILTLRAGMMVILLKNLDIPNGLCNGTRMMIIRCGDLTITCRVLTGPRAKSNAIVVIPYAKFEYGTKKSERGLKFRRVQLPVIPSFAMSINKAQGQSAERVGLHLGRQVFTGGLQDIQQFTFANVEL